MHGQQEQRRTALDVTYPANPDTDVELWVKLVAKLTDSERPDRKISINIGLPTRQQSIAATTETRG